MADLGKSTIYDLTVATNLDVKGTTKVKELKTTNKFIVSGIEDEVNDGSASFELERRTTQDAFIDSFRVANIKSSGNNGFLKFQKKSTESENYEDILYVNDSKELTVLNNILPETNATTSSGTSLGSNNKRFFKIYAQEVDGKVSSLTAAEDNTAAKDMPVYFYEAASISGAGILKYNKKITINPSDTTLKIGEITINGSAASSIIADTFTGNLSGNASTSTKLSSNRNFILTGDVTGTVNSNLESGFSIETTVGDDSHSHTSSTLPFDIVYTGTIQTISGVKTFSGANVYSAVNKFTNSTASTSKSTGAVVITGGLGVSGAIYASSVNASFTGTLTGNASTASKLATAVTISLSGAVIGSKSFDGSAGIDISTTLSNLASNKVTALTGYSKQSIYSAITTSDSLNTAIGKLEGNFSNYLPLKGGTLSGTLNTRALAGTWINGKTTVAIAFDSLKAITSGSYHPFFGMKSYGENVINFGGLGNNIGFYGFYKATTANQSDFSFVCDTTTGNWTCNKKIIAIGGFSGNLIGSANTVQVSTTDSGTNYYLTGANSVGDTGKSLYGSNSVYLLNNNIYANGFYATSSRKYKENIEKTSSSALDIIKQTEVVNFNYINDENKTPKIGIIAEDAPDILVSPDKGSIDTSNCIGVLLKACQELNERVEALEKEVTELKRKKSLKERIFGVKKNG